MQRAQPYLRITWLLMPLLLLAYACEEEDAEPEEELHPIIGKWYASGENVATIFRAPPLNIDSIFMNIGTVTDRRNRLTIEECKTQEGKKYVIAADTDFADPHVENYAIYDYEEVTDNIYIIDIPGKDYPAYGASRNKVDLHQTSFADWDGHKNVTIYGLFKIDTLAEPYTMIMEYYYQSWPVNRNILLEGFGNTQYSEHGIHHFTKIESDENTQ